MADESFFDGMSVSGSSAAAIDPVRIQALLSKATAVSAGSSSCQLFDTTSTTFSLSGTATSDSVGSRLLEALIDYAGHSPTGLPSALPSNSSVPNAIMVYVNDSASSSNDSVTASCGAYRFNEADLIQFFGSTFGPLVSVTLSPDMASAIIIFASSIQAAAALTKLHNKAISITAPGLSPKRVYLKVVPSYQWSSAPQNSTVPIIRKYTCRFDIQIDNDKEFHVARRIIGLKGANMKKIVKQSGYDAKLRLRGRGSGFLEGTQKQESNEPLHLCISCKDYNGYIAAVRQVNELLAEIYVEYKEYCRMRHQAFPDNLNIIMQEHLLMFHHPVSSTLVGNANDSASVYDNGNGGPMGTSNYTAGVSTPSMSSPLVDEFRFDSNAPSDLIVLSSNGSISDLKLGSGVAGSHLLPTSSITASIHSSDENVESLIEQRNEARRVCNFQEADRIRDILRTRGIGLMDEPGGRGKAAEVTTWKYWRM